MLCAGDSVVHSRKKRCVMPVLIVRCDVCCMMCAGDSVAHSKRERRGV